MDLLDGIESRVVDTDRRAVDILVRTADDTTTPAERTVVLLHDGASIQVWQELMQDLPSDLRVAAVDVSGFGVGEQPPSDGATGGGDANTDISDDLRDVLSQLDLDAAHLIGCALGAVDLPSAFELAGDPDRPAVHRRALLEAIAYIGHPASPAPPTSAIIISSSD